MNISFININVGNKTVYYVKGTFMKPNIKTCMYTVVQERYIQVVRLKGAVIFYVVENKSTITNNLSLACSCTSTTSYRKVFSI